MQKNEFENFRRFEDTISELLLYTRKNESDVITAIKNSMLERNIEWEKYSQSSIIDFHRQTEANLFCLSKWNIEEKYQSIIDYIFYITKKTSNSILDFGGGIGTLTIHLLINGLNVDFMEVPSNTLNYALWRFKRRFLDPEVYTTLNQINKQYDCIIALDVFEVLEKPHAHLKKFSEMLNKHGLLILSKGNLSNNSHPMNLPKNKEFFDNFDRYAEEAGFSDSIFENKFHLNIKQKN